MAKAAARATFQHLWVGEVAAPVHLTEEQKVSRRRLRAHGRQLDDQRHKDNTQDIGRLTQEITYAHWHRMLFARFLAENHLLMHPDGVPLTLAECDELTKDEGATNGWELAGRRYESRMLSQIFRSDAPALQVTFAPNHQRALEKLLAGLDPEVFSTSDSLGWVYQFWQAKRYHLVLTNVPYLTRGKQCDQLKAFCENHYPRAKNDLANVFLERCLELRQPYWQATGFLSGNIKVLVVRYRRKYYATNRLSLTAKEVRQLYRSGRRWKQSSES